MRLPVALRPRRHRHRRRLEPRHLLLSLEGLLEFNFAFVLIIRIISSVKSNWYNDVGACLGKRMLLYSYSYRGYPICDHCIALGN